jgi:GntR family transcriptional regulator
LGAVAQRILGRPVWWTEENERAVAVQLTHGSGTWFAERFVSETGSEVKVELSLRRRAGGRAGAGPVPDLGDLSGAGSDDASPVTLSTLRAHLREPLGDRRLVMVVDGDQVSPVRASEPGGPTGLCARSVPAQHRVPPHRAGDPVRAGIPEHGRVPRYYAVKTELLGLVHELGQGAALPSERELADRFGVSRVTLRQAVSELVLEGRLQRKHGSGTYVAPPKLVQPLALVSYTEGMRRQGVEPGRTVTSLEQLPADETLAEDLLIEPGEPVIHIERVLLADGQRVGLESTYLSEQRFPFLVEVFDPGASLYACLQKHFAVVFGEAEERLETVLATPREALLIGTNPALPMLLLHRVTHDVDGRPVERVRSLYRGDRFSFVARLHAHA